MPKIDDEQHDKDYKALLLLFKKYLKSKTVEDQWESLEFIMLKRARHLIRYAMKGMGMSVKKAIQLMKTPDDELTERDQNKKLSITAALDNLVDFAVAEEYQMAYELPDWYEEIEEGDENYDDFVKVFNTYNNRYARVENLDVMFAMIIAAEWADFKNNSILIYTTQGDERVRPWHADWEGFEAPKYAFPDWLIPPIEVACRCYLVEDSEVGVFSKIQAANDPQMPVWFNRVYKESVAKGGRIFSDEHRYFQIDSVHEARLHEIADRIKDKIYRNNDNNV